MSINNLNTYLNVRDAHLRVVSGNVYAQAMNIGGINVETAHGLQSVSNTGNATSLTLEFANVTTGFVTTANAQIGRDLVVTGNTTVSKELTVTSNAIVSSNLNVSDDLVVTNNILASNNLTVTGNLHVTTIMSDSNVVTEYTGPHDRPLRKYPEVAMTSDSQGGYVVTPSTQNATHVAYHMFDGDRSTRWVAQGSTDSYNSSSPYLYNGSNSSSISDTSGTSHDGAFLKLELPTAIKLDYTIIRENSDPASRTPGKITFLGSTNGTDWTFLKEFSGMSNTALDETYTINDTNYYNHFAFVVKNLSDGDGVLDLGEWELYGYEEGSGSLDTTLKSVYNVPATTGTQLEVYYDGRETSSYSGSGTTVTDISPNTNNGTLNGGVGFDSTYKAFTFDGTDDRILSRLQNPAGESLFSGSLWYKPAGSSGGQEGFVWIGTHAIGKAFIFKYNSPNFEFSFYGNDAIFNYSLNGGTWYHIAFAFSGGTASSSRKIWVNGVEVAYTSGASSTALNLDANAQLMIGDRTDNGADLNGSISNFKLYDCTLTAEEVKTLYDMGRCDEGHHVVNFSKTRVGIGLGDGEAPTYTLDVRGQIRSQGSPVTSFTGQHRCFPDEPVEKGLIVSAKKNRFVKLNGFATGQEAITIDESLPIVSLSNVAEDKACFGVVSSIEKPTPKRTQVTNGIISDSKKERGDNRAIVNSVGEGAIWIVNTGGPLESGDYITTSSVKGYGQYQSSQYLTNFTVAKITMDCDFNPAIQPVLRIKKDDDGMNILDEHGQLQWEEHPTETERAYKIRYLDANGTETDEANAVHIAAFVGCTYHCG